MGAYVADLLRASPAFAAMPDDALRELVAASSPVSLRAGDWLFRAGDPANAAYVVQSGRIEVLLPVDGVEHVARTLWRGAIIGELALLTRASRSASVRAARDSELLAIGAHDFMRVASDPVFALALATSLAKQLQSSADMTPVQTRPSVVAVVAVHDDVPARVLFDAIASSFELQGSVARIEAGGEPLGRVIADAEAAQDFVVVFAGPGAADAARHADRVVAVADVSRDVTAVAAGCDLVCIGPAARVQAWMDAVRPRARHVLREASLDSDVARVVRRVTGRSVGIALSGGGARGFAHIGVLEVLLAAGVRIDRVAGCSMGALIGAMYAAGYTPERMVEIVRSELVQRNPFNDYTLPGPSLIRANKARRMLERIFSTWRIEALPIDFSCVSADLLTAQPLDHRTGPLVEAVGSSMSVPGLVPPVSVQDYLLVDGGLLDNLPVSSLSGDDGPIVAVDVASEFRFRPGTKIEGHGRTRVPAVVEILARSSVLASRRRARGETDLADVRIVPDVGSVRMLDFQSLDSMVEAGRAAAREALRTHAALLLG